MDFVPIATTTMSQAISNSEPGSAAGGGGRSVGLAELHLVQRRPVTQRCVVAEDLERRGEELEPDALLLGVVDLLGPGRQLVAAAAVDDRGLGRAEPAGGPDGVHRHVAAADDDDPLAVQDRRVGLRRPRRPSG